MVDWSYNKQVNIGCVNIFPHEFQSQSDFFCSTVQGGLFTWKIIYVIFYSTKISACFNERGMIDDN